MYSQNMTFRQFQREFRTERACVDRLFKLRWPDGYRCPKCGHSGYSFHSTRRLYQCGRCKYQASVTAGTIFHKTRTPLVLWFWMIFIMTRQKSGVSMLSLQGMLGVKTYKTVWAMSHKIRKAMEDRDSQYQLTGLVETMRASLKSTKPTSAGKKPNDQSSVIVKVENRGNTAGLAMMRHVPRKDEGQTEAAMDSRHSAKSRPPTDQLPHGSGTLAPDQNCDELNPLLISDRRPRRIRWARILMANLTGNIRGVHHGVSAKHLHRYLAEFLYRFNRRGRGAQLMNLTLTACLSASTITYAELKI